MSTSPRWGRDPGAPPTAHTAPAFVGRLQEIDLLQGCLDEATGGRAQIVLLQGDAGIGKTRLIRELRPLALARGFRVCHGRCHENLALPYLPFIESLLAQVNALAAGADEALAHDLQVIDRFLHGADAYPPPAPSPITIACACSSRSPTPRSRSPALGRSSFSSTTCTGRTALPSTCSCTSR